MHKILFFITFIISISVSAQEVQLSWQKDLTIAKELAKAENKMVLIYFTKSDCETCQQFYRDFFKQEEFKRLSDAFVLVLLEDSNKDIQSNDLNLIKQRRWAMHYNKSSTYPAVLLIDNEGQERGDLMTSTTREAIETYWNFLDTLK